MPTPIRARRTTEKPERSGHEPSRPRSIESIGDVRILVADPEAVDRAALSSLLDSHPGFRVVGETESVQSTIHRVRELDPDVVLLTVTLPSLDGAPACTELLLACPELRIVALSERGWDRCLVLNPPGPSSLPIVPSRSAS